MHLRYRMDRACRLLVAISRNFELLNQETHILKQVDPSLLSPKLRDKVHWASQQMWHRCLRTFSMHESVDTDQVAESNTHQAVHGLGRIQFYS